MTPSLRTYTRALARQQKRHSFYSAGDLHKIARRRAKNKMAQQSRRRNRRQK